MPANPGQVNQVDLTAPGHVLRFTEADAKLLRDATLHQAGPEPIHIIQLHIHHKVFGKGTVIEMLQHIQSEGGNIKKFVEMAKDKNSSFRLMGFGHRVYKNFDPRAKIIKKTCMEVLSKLGVKDALLEIAIQLEEAALKDDYFVERKLYPNVDFYSGLIYRAIGIPTEMFTVMFALGRMPGWIAQWKEMIENPSAKIGRPRQIYNGATLRPFVTADKRG